ncbi:uncharacterized protein VTP21DRAFT_7214 [Calcarisporiella thermophila]|uniref:uncharacterized protein n=1 Tax=Calcarisporiella thermophila TaxID=911321 RepID=UPI0037436412
MSGVNPSQMGTSPISGKRGRPVADVWDHFRRGEKQNQCHYQAHCVYCEAVLGENVEVGRVTGKNDQMRRHLLNCSFAPEDVKNGVRAHVQAQIAASATAAPAGLRFATNNDMIQGTPAKQLKLSHTRFPAMLKPDFSMSSRNSPYACLLPPSWSTKITEWLQEDVPSFDYGGFVVGDTEEVAVLFGKSEGVLAGVPFFDEVFRQLDCKVEWFLNEGDTFEPVKEVARVYGKARNILLGERTALNIIARCSGIAYKAKKVHDLKLRYGFHGVIAGTRKTTPGFRIVEKYGMLVGGADTHRFDLSSMIMLKDNHIWSQGSITRAVQLARSAGGFSLKIEVECRSEAEADEAIAAGADVIMLDNFDCESLKMTARALKQRWSGRRHFLIECSGGITEDTAEQYFCDDIDILSMGALSQGVPHVDYSLKIDKKR